MLTCTPPAAWTCSSILPSICSGESFSGLGNNFAVKEMTVWKKCNDWLCVVNLPNTTWKVFFLAIFGIVYQSCHVSEGKIRDNFRLLENPLLNFELSSRIQVICNRSASSVKHWILLVKLPHPIFYLKKFNFRPIYDHSKEMYRRVNFCPSPFLRVVSILIFINKVYTLLVKKKTINNLKCQDHW